VQFGFIEDPPATGATGTAIKGIPELAAQPGISTGMPGGRAWMRMQITIENFPHQLFRQGEDIVVGGLAWGGVGLFIAVSGEAALNFREALNNYTHSTIRHFGKARIQ